MVLGHLAAVSAVTILAVALVERDGAFIKSVFAIYLLVWVASVSGPYLLDLAQVVA